MKTPKRYLLFGDGESPHLAKIARQLVGLYEVWVISGRGIHNELQLLLPPHRLIALNLTIRPEGGNTALLHEIPGIYRLIGKIRPHVVNAHYLTSYGFVAAVVHCLRFSAFTLVQSVWGSDVLLTPGKGWYYRFINRFSLSRASLITSTAQSMSDGLERTINRPVYTFAHGLEHMPPETDYGKIPWRFFSNRSLLPLYRIQKIIELFGQVQQLYPDASLVIANTGPLLDDLRQVVLKLPDPSAVSFVGYLGAEAQSEMYRQAMFYVSLPESDASSVSLLEAMTWGCIPLVADLPAMHEWIESGRNGAIVYPGLPLELENLQNRQAMIQKINREIIMEKGFLPLAIQPYLAALSAIVEIKPKP
jgi:glycosyltransferase involved in cell wall biosynthesis